jgi:hypothetical protein
VKGRVDLRLRVASEDGEASASEETRFFGPF